MNQQTFVVESVVKFIIINNGISNFAFNKVCDKYKNFRQDSNLECDLEVYLGKFDPNNSDCIMINNNYFIKDGYLYCQSDSYKFAKWNFELTGLESNKITAKIDFNLFGCFVVSGYVIDVLIRILSNRKGYPFVHASCVSKGDKGYLFPSRSGAGKTTIALNLVKNCYKFISDDYTLIGRDGAIGYKSMLNIFTYNLTDSVRDHMSLSNKAVLILKGYLYKISLGFIKIFTTISPQDMFPESITKECNLSTIYLLIPHDRFKIDLIDRKSIVDHMIYSQQLESLPLTKHLIEYSYIFPKSKIAGHWNLYKLNLINNLPEDAIYYRIEVPNKLNDKFFSKLAEYLQ